MLAWGSANLGEKPSTSHKEDARDVAVFTAVIWPVLLAIAVPALVLFVVGYLIWNAVRTPAKKVAKGWEKFPLVSNIEREGRKAWNQHRDMRTVPKDER
jgi:hypothetical protein